MRKIVLDTETTGLYPQRGHRIVEIAAMELNDAAKYFHSYLNPECRISRLASAVHGLTRAGLRNEPKFAEIAPALIEFIHGAELIIHNAPFDIGFLNHEFKLADLQPLSDYCPSVIDTLPLARELHPRHKVSLDELCERYQIDNSHRTFHGAMQDVKLLREVYGALMRDMECTKKSS
jgi:DNA polymerase-3 subunit epsilon